MIDILTFPILSILNTSYLAYIHKDEIEIKKRTTLKP